MVVVGVGVVVGGGGAGVLVVGGGVLAVGVVLVVAEGGRLVGAGARPECFADGAGLPEARGREGAPGAEGCRSTAVRGAVADDGLWATSTARALCTLRTWPR